MLVTKVPEGQVTSDDWSPCTILHLTRAVLFALAVAAYRPAFLFALPSALSPSDGTNWLSPRGRILPSHHTRRYSAGATALLASAQALSPTTVWALTPTVVLGAGGEAGEGDRGGAEGDDRLDISAVAGGGHLVADGVVVHVGAAVLGGGAPAHGELPADGAGGGRDVDGRGGDDGALVVGAVHENTALDAPPRSVLSGVEGVSAVAAGSNADLVSQGRPRA